MMILTTKNEKHFKGYSISFTFYIHCFIFNVLANFSDGRRVNPFFFLYQISCLLKCNDFILDDNFVNYCVTKHLVSNFLDTSDSPQIL